MSKSKEMSKIEREWNCGDVYTVCQPFSNFSTPGATWIGTENNKGKMQTILLAHGGDEVEKRLLSTRKQKDDVNLGSIEGCTIIDKEVVFDEIYFDGRCIDCIAENNIFVRCAKRTSKIIADYDSFLSIDSSLKEVNGIWIAVGVLIEWDLTTNSETGHISYIKKSWYALMFVYSNKPEKFENEIWGNIVWKHCEEGYINLNKVYAVFVDSDYSNLKEYYDGGVVFPDGTVNSNFRFHYANFKGSNYSFWSNLMYITDKASQISMKKLENLIGEEKNPTIIVKIFTNDILKEVDRIINTVINGRKNSPSAI